jgi:hypothetical protein
MKIFILVILLLFSAASHGLDYGRLVFINADSLLKSDSYSYFIDADGERLDLSLIDIDSLIDARSRLYSLDLNKLNKYLITVPEQVNILRYKQGGLCLFFDCKINPNNAFVAIIKPWNDWVMLRNFASLTMVSKYDDSTHLYIYKDVLPEYEDFYDSYKSFKKDRAFHFANLKDNTDYWLKENPFETFEAMAAGYSTFKEYEMAAIYVDPLPSCRKNFNSYSLVPSINRERRKKVMKDPFDRDKAKKKYEDFENINNSLNIEKKLIYARKNKLCHDYSWKKKDYYSYYKYPEMQFCYISDEFNNITKKELFKAIKKDDIAMVYRNDNFWDTLIRDKRGESLASLKQRCFCAECHSRSCPVEPINGAVKVDSCTMVDSKFKVLRKWWPCLWLQESSLSYCIERLSCAQEEYDILYHIGPFAGDCDLSNWKGIRLKDLSKEELEQFKKRYYWWEE